MPRPKATPAPPAVLDLTKVLAAVAALSAISLPAPRGHHMALRPVDADRRRPLYGTRRDTCHGFNHGAFEHNF